MISLSDFPAASRADNGKSVFVDANSTWHQPDRPARIKAGLEQYGEVHVLNRRGVRQWTMVPVTDAHADLPRVHIHFARMALEEAGEAFVLKTNDEDLCTVAPYGRGRNKPAKHPPVTVRDHGFGAPSHMRPTRPSNRWWCPGALKDKTLHKGLSVRVVAPDHNTIENRWKALGRAYEAATGLPVRVHAGYVMVEEGGYVTALSEVTSAGQGLLNTGWFGGTEATLKVKPMKVVHAPLRLL